MMGFQGRSRMGLLALCAVFVFSNTSLAALGAVSDDIPEIGDPTKINVSLANGLPIWYEDENGVKLAQCLDLRVSIPGIEGTVDPCNIGMTFPQFPPSLTHLSRVNYWEANAAFNYQSLDENIEGAGLFPGGFALLVLRVSGTGAGLGALVEGNQAVASRIRLRIDVPVPGTYRVTHPFGTVDYVISAEGRRAIDQTQDVGNLAADVQNFLAGMRDRVGFVLPGLEDIFDPAEDEGPFGAVVNSDGRSVGPFLIPTLAFDPATFSGGPVTAENGDIYIGLPFGPVPPIPPLEIFQTVSPGPEITLLDEGGTEFVDYFRIELLDPPAGFFLNGPEESQVLETNLFQVVGKVFDEGPNQAPQAPEVVVGLLKGRAVVDIDVFAGVNLNDFDPVGAPNVHGIDPQAIALADPITGVFRRELTNMPLLTPVQALANGSVRRITRLASGQSLFRYLPSLSASGSDTFHYVVQDTGGMMSLPSPVRVVIEDLQVERAEFRAKTGKLHIAGASDQALINESTPNRMTIMAGPRARLTGDGLNPVVDTAMRGQVALSAGAQAADYRLVIDGVEAPNAISSVDLHVGVGANPIIFRLCGTPVIFPFPPACSVNAGRLDIDGSLSNSNLLFDGTAGVLDLDGAIDAIFAGNTYVNVVTTAHPGGELRGALETPVIAEGIEMNGQSWEFRGKTKFSLGLLPNVTVRSETGAQTYSIPVRLR